MSEPDGASIRLIVSTIPEASAAAFVRDLVERRLIACGNIVPGVTSIYRWEGKIIEDAEAMLWMETTVERLPALRAVFDAAHPYDVSKFIEIAPSEWSQAFAAWVQSSTGGGGS